MAQGKVLTKNRKAYHDYHIEEAFEAGVALTGTEVKALREGRANLRDGYGAVESGEVFLLNCHISPYAPANRFNHDPRRRRKLLLHRAEIRRLIGKVQERGAHPRPAESLSEKRPGQSGAGPVPGEETVR